MDYLSVARNRHIQTEGKIGLTGQICQESGLYTSICCHRTPIALSKYNVFPPCQRGDHAAFWNLVIPADLLDLLPELPNPGETIVDQWRRRHTPSLKLEDTLLGRRFKEICETQGASPWWNYSKNHAKVTVDPQKLRAFAKAVSAYTKKT